MSKCLVLAKWNVGRGIHVEWGRQGTHKDSTDLASRVPVAGLTALVDLVDDLDQGGLLLVIAEGAGGDIQEDYLPERLGLDEVLNPGGHVGDAWPDVKDDWREELDPVDEGSSL